MRRALIRTFLMASKYLGLFEVSRKLTANRLRVLCYHGMSLEDEHMFRTGLFMTPSTFRRRMDYLADREIPVLSLREGVERLYAGSLPPCAAVITIDDGFASVYSEARPVLAEKRFPATLYLTSYYFQKQTPIYRLIISYILWKAPDGMVVDLSQLGVPDLQSADNLILTGPEKERIEEILRDYGETACDEPTRQAISEKLGAATGVDYRRIRESRILNLVSEQEALGLEQSSIGVELHTHRHNFPRSHPEARTELGENIAVLASTLGKDAKHFCYPSGEWSREHWPVLEELGIETATTCDSGLARADTHRYALPRILDDMRVSQIEFEAEVCGYNDLIRDVRRVLSGRPRGRPDNPQPS